MPELLPLSLQSRAMGPVRDFRGGFPSEKKNGQNRDFENRNGSVREGGWLVGQGFGAVLGMCVTSKK